VRHSKVLDPRRPRGARALGPGPPWLEARAIAGARELSDFREREADALRGVDGREPAQDIGRITALARDAVGLGHEPQSVVVANPAVRIPARDEWTKCIQINADYYARKRIAAKAGLSTMAEPLE
jgi:hypothetical protein